MPWLLEIVYIRDVRIYVSNRLEFLLGMGCPPQKLVTVSWNAGNFSLYPNPRHHLPMWERVQALERYLRVLISVFPNHIIAYQC
jgi:hypothetical protein